MWGNMATNLLLDAERKKISEFDWAGWNDWVSWQELAASSFRQVPTSCGAYVIATNRKIHRAIGVDPEGFLDIGETGRTVRHRLREFQKCATTRLYENHMAGYRFAYFYFARYYPLESLRVRWIVTEAKEAAYRAEGRLLLTYLYRHGELPPLNYKFNWDGLSDFEGDVLERCLGVGDPTV